MRAVQTKARARTGALEAPEHDPLQAHALVDPLVAGAPAPATGTGVRAQASPVTQAKRPAPPGAVWKSKGNVLVWFGKDESEVVGHLFEKAHGKSDDRGDLLGKMTTSAEAIGQSTAGLDWVRDARNYDKVNVVKTDPFRVRLTGTYGEGDTPLAMGVHYGPFNHGYVVKVEDHGKSAMIDARNHLVDAPGVAPSFSNKHYDTGDDTLLDHTDYTHGVGSRTQGSERAWDSYTKLLGEGARFNCVKNHQSKLADSTRFYTRDDEGNDIKYVTFDQLWLSWSATFNKVFGVGDAAVKAKIDADAMRGLNYELAVTDGGPGDITPGRDYNLEDSRAATDADTHRWKELVVDIAGDVDGDLSDQISNAVLAVEGVMWHRPASPRKKWTLTIWEDADEEAIKDAIHDLAPIEGREVEDVQAEVQPDVQPVVGDGNVGGAGVVGGDQKEVNL